MAKLWLRSGAQVLVRWRKEAPYEDPLHNNVDGVAREFAYRSDRWLLQRDGVHYRPGLLPGAPGYWHHWSWRRSIKVDAEMELQELDAGMAVEGYRRIP